MNEAFEVELTKLEASFSASPFDLVLGVEKQTTVKVEESDGITPFTDVEWQIIYARVLLEDRWHFLPQHLYDEIDDKYGELIGDKLWELTQTI